jgi:hypothetical protein
MGLRRAQGSRSKQYDSDERRHILVDRPGVRESGMRLPSEMGRGWALSVAASLRLRLWVTAGRGRDPNPSCAHGPHGASIEAK